MFGASHVSPARFDDYSWLAPVRPPFAPKWFYWVERSAPNDGEFVDLRTVDPLVLPIVACANARGVRTLPSCEGHFPSKDEVRGQVHWLQREEPDIQHDGLLLSDVETGKRYFLHDSSYQAPVFERLWSDVHGWSGVGRVGFVLQDRDVARQLARRVLPAGLPEFSGDKLSITVHGVAPDDLAERWRHVFRAVEDVL